MRLSLPFTQGLSRARTLLGSLRQSWAGSPAEESQIVNTGVFGLVATGACVLVVSTILFLDSKSQQAQRSWQAENNLLQMRVQWHKLITKEWGRNDQVNGVIAGELVCRPGNNS